MCGKHLEKSVEVQIAFGQRTLSEISDESDWEIFFHNIGDEIQGSHLHSRMLIRNKCESNPLFAFISIFVKLTVVVS